MKKLISLILVLIFTAALLTGCASSPAAETDTETAEKSAVRIGSLKGPTSIGMVKLLSDAENDAAANEYEFTLAGSADELTPLFIKGDIDIIAVPVNLAAILYGKTEGNAVMLAVNTLGVTYIVENGDSIADWNSLKGKTIYATGKGSVPEYALRYLMTQNGLDPDKDVTIDWKSEPTEVVALMKSEANVVAMLPQPYVTAAAAQVENLRVALDMTESWDALDNGSRLITAGIIARKSFAEENPDAVANFMKDYAASAGYANSAPADAAVLVEKYGIAKAAIAEKAIPACNIVCISGNEMKTALQGFYGILFSMEPKSVGGNMPEDNFYYAG